MVREGKVREALSKGEAAPPPEDEGPGRPTGGGHPWGGGIAQIPAHIHIHLISDVHGNVLDRLKVRNF